MGCSTAFVRRFDAIAARRGAARACKQEVSKLAELVAIGYPDETTAAVAAQEAERLAKDLILQPDAIAVITRDKSGKYHVTTNHNPVAGGATWGMFWGLLFGLLFFVPVLGMAVGAGLGALMGKVEKTGIDKEFQEQVRAMVQPGTSALFLIVEKATPDKAVAAMSRFGGTVLKSSLSERAEAELQEALHGASAAASASAASTSAASGGREERGFPPALDVRPAEVIRPAEVRHRLRCTGTIGP